jgi:alpha-D-ribose 1-methylphosphonate 5-triphosphate synthase subunit PhnH
MSSVILSDAGAFEALDSVASHAIFTALLETLSRPGTLGQLVRGKGQEALPFPLLVPLALADVDVTLAILTPPDVPSWAERLTHVTGASARAMEDADIVVAFRNPSPDEVRSLRRGALDTPERGARLVLACQELSSGSDDLPVQLALSGPGIPAERSLGIGGLSVEVIETLVAINRKFPLGVDTYLVDGQGRIVGLPRTTQIRIERGGLAWATQR